MGKSHRDLVLSHMADHVKLRCSLLWDGLVGYSLQFKVELLKEILKKQ